MYVIHIRFLLSCIRTSWSVARPYIQAHVLRCYSKSIRVAQYISSVCMASTCTTSHISVHTQPMKHPHGRYDSKYRLQTLSYYITHSRTHHIITVFSVCSHTDKLVLVLRALNAIDDPLCMHVQYICIPYRVALAYTYSYSVSCSYGTLERGLRKGIARRNCLLRVCMYLCMWRDAGV